MKENGIIIFSVSFRGNWHIELLLAINLWSLFNKKKTRTAMLSHTHIYSHDIRSFGWMSRRIKFTYTLRSSFLFLSNKTLTHMTHNKPLMFACIAHKVKQREKTVQLKFLPSKNQNWVPSVFFGISHRNEVLLCI